MNLNWNFQGEWGVLEKILSVGEVWIFSGNYTIADAAELHTVITSVHL